MSTMDPLFGLPCMKDSRRMDSARSKNQAEEKILARKFEALDVDLKCRSSKLITQRGSLEEFRSRVEQAPPRLSNMPSGLSKHQQEQYKRLHLKQDGLSMSLSDLDKQLAMKRTRKFTDPHLAQVLYSDTDSHYQSDESLAGGVDGEEDDSYVVRPRGDPVMPINRKKHAMKAAWDRATTDDVRFSSKLTRKSLSSSSLISPSRNTSQFLFSDARGLESPTSAFQRTHLEVPVTLPFSSKTTKHSTESARALTSIRNTTQKTRHGGKSKR